MDSHILDPIFTSSSRIVLNLIVILFNLRWSVNEPSQETAEIINRGAMGVVEGMDRT